MTEDGEVAGIDAEAVVDVSAARARVAEEILGGLEHRPAGLADQMAVGLGGQVVGGRAVAQVGVDDDPEPLELVEVAVDGREVDVGGRGLDLGGQLFGRAVAGGPRRGSRGGAGGRW